MASDFGVNQGLVEQMFLRWVDNPGAVDEAWQRYFEQLDPTEWPQLTSAGSIAAPTGVQPSGGGNGAARGNGAAAETRTRSLSGLFRLPPTDEALPTVASAEVQGRTSFAPSAAAMAATELQARVSALTNAYRVRGHLFADLDPLGLAPKPDTRELFLERYGLDHVDPETLFSTGDLAGPKQATLREIIQRLEETYTRTIGVEFTFLEDPEARQWLQHTMEESCNHIELTREERLRILTKLTDAEIFEQFLHTKFIGAKRFSIEGGESVIPMLDQLVEYVADRSVEEIVLGMAHRGRLNVMVNIMEMNVRDIFAGFDDSDPELLLGGGDVKYHLGYSLDRTTAHGKKVHMTLTFNPSHLEWVNPVVEGRVRSKQDRRHDNERRQVLPLLIHGDAAFAGQGIVAETLNLSELEAYGTGGTIHVVINNQIGFTTVPQDSRSTRYATDITRMLRCPVFHVNGDDTEAVVHVARLAAEYRQRFGRDVVIDLWCYRKYGHNEGDEPRFTQPVMYSVIDKKKTPREIYIEQLVEQGVITPEIGEEIKRRRLKDLEAALDESRTGDYALLPVSMKGLWSPYRGGRDRDCPEVATSVPRETLDRLLDRMTQTPDWFEPHPRLKRFVLDKQRKILETGQNVDWGTAENLAMATLLDEGTRVRLTGQDARRGTFSHRHAVIYDVRTGRRYTRLGHLSERQAHLEIYDSPLSEAGVLGFEWGYSLDTPDALVGWEAQFGDFANGAQVIIDQFISSSEDKWHRLSGLVMLLPHGFEGMGPEHSSARLERFLTMCAEDNMQIVNCTTPAQIFHVLRRQVVRPWRKPLVVMTPKSLLRHRKAVSTLDELAAGQFQRVIDDTLVDPDRIKRVILCSGKIYYDLLAGRESRHIDEIALVRLEQLYPYRPEEIQAIIDRYPSSADIVWVQEEPWNMGAWYYVRARLADLRQGRPFRCIARPESASPATGSKASHLLEQERLVDEALSL